MSDEDAPLPSARCPWCGSSTRVGKKYRTIDSQVPIFFVYCDTTSCSVIGPSRSNAALAVIAWDEVAARAEKARIE